MRPVRPADICILLRSVKDKAGVYLQALEKRGISGIGENGGGYLYSREISAVLSLLRAVDNPLLDIDLAAAMLSPLAAFTPDELAEIRLKGRDRSLYACLVLHAQENTKSADFLRLVQHLRARSAGIPVSRLITELYDLTGFEAVAGLWKTGVSVCRICGCFRSMPLAMRSGAIRGCPPSCGSSTVWWNPGRIWTRAPWCPPGRIPSPS